MSLQPDFLGVSRPTSFDDDAGWRTFWNFSLRSLVLCTIAPHIPSARRLLLEARRRIIPDRARGIYPFAGVRLSRSDIEWLIATAAMFQPEAVRDWRGEQPSIDLRGADLRGVDLSGLFLWGIWAGSPFADASPEERQQAATLLDGADLRRACLAGAILVSTRLRGANLADAILSADLRGASLEGAAMRHIFARGATFINAQMQGVDLTRAFCKAAYFDGAQLQGATMRQISATRAKFRRTQLVGADLRDARLYQATLREANVQGADLSGAFLSKAKLILANLDGANLCAIYTTRFTNFHRATFAGAQTDSTTFAHATLVDPHLP